ncbi:hypothetical protein GA0070624_3723 [Micromonospora rhizosphaerae]|uniref:Uncharacterized protein n=1 Tax=Micromonospora rhizosphaerae TaxID=568872 RepID=A0A1C6SGI4_9ACTN|nr:hypothetical protein [Micromonospora rhizosphaerae]SCL28595.1 hypothetical protein GA0070624_3723 [Micromonospora rhizosphaerae]
MHTPEADGALRWLAEEGVTPLGPGRWREVTPSGGLERTDSDLAHEWTAAALGDDRLPPSQQLRIGLGLLDLLDEYWVTVELGFFVAEQADPAVIEAFWAGYRQRLEVPEPGTQVLYSLWVDWFEDPGRSASAFAAVIGDDVRNLRARQRLGDLANPPLCRRVSRVLEHSGPVRWADKHDVYEAVVAAAKLRPALFKGLLASYHDVYGDLEPEQALELLGRLNLPPDTEHLATLRAALKTGARNHYRQPELWDAVRQE